MDVPYKPPVFEEPSFSCPHCNVFAAQNWGKGAAFLHNYGEEVRGLHVALCSHCKEVSVWMMGDMIYPHSSSAPLPNPDMDEDVREIYEEARSVVGSSPRAAAALLRLAMERLCTRLNPGGAKRLNDCIQELLDKKIINSRLQKALDSVRVMGNEGIHPGKIDLREKPEIAAMLFKLVNIIVREVVSDSKEIEEIYTSLPEEKLKGIEVRGKSSDKK